MRVHAASINCASRVRRLPAQEPIPGRQGAHARVGGCGMEPEGAMRPLAGLGQNGSMDLHLTGKVVLITGGTDGLGAALADRLAGEGSRVAVCGRDPHRLAAAERRLRDAGGDALVAQADVTNLVTLNGSSMRPSPGGAASTAW